MKKRELAVNEYYRQGIDLLAQCERQFDQGVYEQASFCLLQAYNDTLAEEILDLLLQLIYLPNLANMQANYAKIRQCLIDDYELKFLPEFDDLPVLFFPISINIVRIYDLKQQRFLAVGETVRRYEIYRQAVFGDLEQLTTGVLQGAIQAFVNEQQASVLWRDIKAQISNMDYTNEFLRQVEQYHKLLPSCEKYEYSLAEYYYRERQYLKAEKFARKAYEQRKVNFAICNILAKCYEANGKYEAAVGLYIVAMKYVVPDLEEAELNKVFAKIRSILSKAKTISVERYKRVIQSVNLHYTPVRYSPFLICLNIEKQINENSCLCGEYIYDDKQLYNNFVGIYNADNELGSGAYLLDILKSRKERFMAYDAYTFEIVPSQTDQKRAYCQKDSPYIVPIAGSEMEQTIKFKFAGQEKTMALGKYEYSKFRITEDVEISSAKPLLFGKPIYLQHSTNRKKLILNILLDAFSWGQIKRSEFADIPNIMKFFKNGMIFNNTYSAAEYTFASMPTIETGAYQPKLQIFHPHAFAKLSDAFITTAQHMAAQGYYCANLRAPMETFYNQVGRGFDYMLAKNSFKSSVGVERVIRHLKAFNETDNYVNLHIDDVHPYYEGYQVGIESQTKLGLQDRVSENKGVSVALLYTPARVYQYQTALQNVDRILGNLFAYIEAHYREEEFIVNLHSDHGTSIFAKNPYLLNETHSCSALMLRGAGIPQHKIVDDEVVSAIDVHSIMAKVAGYSVDENILDCRLPKAFGGTGREYTYSNVFYPGQNYQLCIRDLQYEFRLATEAKTTYDGRINMNHFTCNLYTRDQSHTEIFDNSINERFIRAAYAYTKTLHDVE